MWVTCYFNLTKVMKIVLNFELKWFFINISANLYLMGIKPGYMESPSKTRSDRVIQSKSRKIDLFRKSGKGLAFSRVQKGPKYKNSISTVHFEDHFILVMNLWVFRYYYLNKVVKIIENIGSK